MDYLKYTYRSIARDGSGREILSGMMIPDSEANRLLAQRESWDGVITIVTGEEDPTTEVRVQELEEALDLLLTGVTE